MGTRRGRVPLVVGVLLTLLALASAIVPPDLIASPRASPPIYDNDGALNNTATRAIAEPGAAPTAWATDGRASPSTGGIRAFTSSVVAAITGKPVIGFAPDAPAAALAEWGRQGLLVTNDLSLLLDVVAP